METHVSKLKDEELFGLATSCIARLRIRITDGQWEFVNINPTNIHEVLHEAIKRAIEKTKDLEKVGKLAKEVSSILLHASRPGYSWDLTEQGVDFNNSPNNEPTYKPEQGVEEMRKSIERVKPSDQDAINVMEQQVKDTLSGYEMEAREEMLRKTLTNVIADKDKAIDNLNVRDAIVTRRNHELGKELAELKATMIKYKDAVEVLADELNKAVGNNKNKP